jgi:hypothetical protein
LSSDSFNLLWYKYKFFKNKYTWNYSYLIYDKNNKFLEIEHCEWMDWWSTSFYNTFINWKGINTWKEY